MDRAAHRLHGGPNRNLRALASCVNGCPPTWTTFTFTPRSPRATLFLPSCSCGSTVRFIEAVAMTAQQAAITFPRPLSPRELAVFLDEALDPVAGHA